MSLRPTTVPRSIQASAALLAVLAAMLTLGCVTPRAAAPVAAAPVVAASVSYDVLNAHLWQQTAEEYRASALQAYAAAARALDLALTDPSWTAAPEQVGSDFSRLPPAIILDVDETVLDNSPYATRSIKAQRRYERESWHAWCREHRAKAIPGAVEFTRYAAGKGVTVFYVSNREAEVQEATRQNLREAGFPLSEARETVFNRGSRPEWNQSDKGPRRRFIASEFRVVLLVGDDLNDFLSGAKTNLAERTALAAPYDTWWGSHWIMLPNPVYGSWEDAVLGLERGLSEPEILRRKLGAMRE